MFLRTNLLTDRTKQGVVKESLPNASMNVDECFHRSIFLSNISSSAPCESSSSVRSRQYGTRWFPPRVREVVTDLECANSVCPAALVTDALTRLSKMCSTSSWIISRTIARNFAAQGNREGGWGCRVYWLTCQSERKVFLVGLYCLCEGFHLTTSIATHVGVRECCSEREVCAAKDAFRVTRHRC